MLNSWDMKSGGSGGDGSRKGAISTDPLLLHWVVVDKG
jgi:hypothetical protein